MTLMPRPRPAAAFPFHAEEETAMHRDEIASLDPTRTYWVPSIVAPHRNWAGVPGCRSGARFMVNSETLRPSRDEFSTFDSQSSCLQWILRNRAQLNRTLPGVRIRAVPLDRWLLGLE